MAVEAMGRRRLAVTSGKFLSNVGYEIACGKLPRFLAAE